MGVKRIGPFIHRGNFEVTGTLRTDASAYITGPLYGATGVTLAADVSIGLRLDCATGIDVCGPVTAATAVTVCGAAQ